MTGRGLLRGWVCIRSLGSCAKNLSCGRQKAIYPPRSTNSSDMSTAGTDTFIDMRPARSKQSSSDRSLARVAFFLPAWRFYRSDPCRSLLKPFRSAPATGICLLTAENSAVSATPEAGRRSGPRYVKRTTIHQCSSCVLLMPYNQLFQSE